MAGTVVTTFNTKNTKPASGMDLQGAGGSVQGSVPLMQGSSPAMQGSSPALQVTADPSNMYSVGSGATNTNGVVLGENTTVDPNAAKRAALVNSLLGRKGDVQAIYDALFGDLDTLLKSKAGELDTQYDGQLSKASQDFADVLPTIDQSYAALGSYDSTQRGDNRKKAQTGYEDTVKTIGTNKTKDQAALGQYGNESKAKIQADKDAALRYIDSSANTTDTQALQDASNSLDTNLSQAKVTQAGLGTDGNASQQVKGLTADNGRFQAAIDSLHSIVNSSMPSSVKQAAVEAVTNAGGLSDADKKKVQAQFGNVYAEQATL